MNMDPTIGEFEVALRLSLRSLTRADRDRLQAPEYLWSRIEAGLRSAVSEQAADAPRAKVIPLRRQRRVVTVVGALAVAAAAAIAIPLAVSSRNEVTVLAAAPLTNEGLAAFDATPAGSARLVSSHGHEFLEVSVQNVPNRAGDHLELWLIDTAVKGMVSLGPYTGSHRYAVPDGISAKAFPIVDLSLEPGDGVPTHSGVSVVRGTLPVSARSA
ncbi:MAG: hypothetical protein F2934_11695 [Actinobacteria bacterium]|uniref:Unannotated protein n=1 Tax=freshwater metagenome TaxID=449393 RepID=A0A6J7UP86_9ZZZZ|nr:hypothetical protein [Actinomycetota bacterium]MSY12551.1 hypothetical protein [Actinomycetota bacterium]MSZ04904.1 hypothetical protein [Actinomycetota bacterium]MTB07779.1 hypothetical protein [Actinomycetota bacterium]